MSNVSFKNWGARLSFVEKTKLTIYLDSTALLGRAPVQSLELYSATFSVITCISVYLAISLLSLWHNSATSLAFTSFQHVQNWLAQAADSQVLPPELMTDIITCSWWSLFTLLSPVPLQWIFIHLLQLWLNKASFNCGIYMSLLYFFSFKSISQWFS